jgi:hypothetical protein
MEGRGAARSQESCGGPRVTHDLGGARGMRELGRAGGMTGHGETREHGAKAEPMGRSAEVEFGAWWQEAETGDPHAEAELVRGRFTPLDGIN